jgi:hypothetical protein
VWGSGVRVPLAPLIEQAFRRGRILGGGKTGES